MNTYCNFPGTRITSSPLVQHGGWPSFLLKLLVADEAQLQSQQVVVILGKAEDLSYMVFWCTRIKGEQPLKQASMFCSLPVEL